MVFKVCKGKCCHSFKEITLEATHALFLCTSFHCSQQKVECMLQLMAKVVGYMQWVRLKAPGHVRC